MVEAGVERPLDQPPHMQEWCNMPLNLRALGHHKLAHITDAERTLLADFTPYWDDFKPFVRRLLTAFWPHNPAYPNKITPEGMLVILKEAQVTVREPSRPPPRLDPAPTTKPSCEHMQYWEASNATDKGKTLLQFRSKSRRSITLWSPPHLGWIPLILISSTWLDCCQFP
jgi:hypothetical protein